MWAHCTCNYCGHKFRYYLSLSNTEKQIRCEICKDNNIKVSRESETKDAFGYEYSEARPDAYLDKYKK